MLSFTTTSSFLSFLLSVALLFSFSVEISALPTRGSTSTLARRAKLVQTGSIPHQSLPRHARPPSPIKEKVQDDVIDLKTGSGGSVMKRIAVRGGMVSFEIPAVEKEGPDGAESEEESAAAGYIPRRGSPTSSPSSSSSSSHSSESDESQSEDSHPHLTHIAQSLLSTLHLTSSSSSSPSSNLTTSSPAGFKISKRSAISSLATHPRRSVSLLNPVEEKVMVGGSGLRVRGLEGVGMKVVARQTTL